MSVTELLHEIQALPSDQRLLLVEKLVQLSESDVPEALRQGMAEAARDELLDFDEVVRDLEKS